MYVKNLKTANNLGANMMILKMFKVGIKNMIKAIHKIIIRNRNIDIELSNLTSNNKTIFIFPSPSTPWGYMFQRPQQIAMSLAKYNNLVFYSVEGNYKYIPDVFVRGIKKIEKNLYLFNDLNSGKTLKNVEQLVVWRYWATQKDYLKEYDKKQIKIYDWIDDISVHGYDMEQKNIHEQLLKEADIVITTSEKLYTSARIKRPDALFIPNACDYKFFDKVIPIKWTELDKLRNKSKVIVGYFGAIAEWFDYDLIKDCAKKYKEWTFLLVGPIYPNVLEGKELDKYPNIVIWNRVSYNKLPYLLSKFDAAIIPFQINNITKATSPVKVYEYMAGGKVVVSTAMNEVKKLKNVLIAENENDFIEKLKLAVDLSNNSEYRDKIKMEAYENSWDSRVSIVLEELKIRGLI